MPRHKEVVIIPPTNGWEAHTWYLVDVSYNRGNPVHRSLFFTGFLDDQDGMPGGYNSLVPLNTPGGERGVTWREVYYLKVIRRLLSVKEAEA